MAGPWHGASTRAKTSRLPWLLLFWWTQVTLWLRRWLTRPLMRLGIGSLDDVEAVTDVENEPDADASSSSQLQDAALPCGLPNNGNLCFANAVLQCLAAVPVFLESVDRALRMRSQLHVVRQPDDAQVQKLLVAETLVSLLRGVSPLEEELELEREAEGEAVDVRRRGAQQERRRDVREDNQQRMRRFRSAASRCSYLVSSAASRQEQQDAEEFLSFLLELLHDLLRVPAQPEREEDEERQQFLQAEKWCLKKLKSYDPNDPRSYMHAVANLGEARWNHFLRRNASVITDLFSGQTVRGSQCCSCANLTCLHEEQRIISLAIASGKGDQTLSECLEHFRHPEQLTDENRVYCDGYCRTKTTRLTQILLQRVPPVLILRLQRFKHTSTRGQTEKVDIPVSFPCGSEELLDITMNAFFRDEEKRVTFELAAVCAHLGNSIDSGHYVAYVRHHNSRQDAAEWLRIDDDVVSVIDEAALRRETLTSAYLLFYTLVTR